MLLDFTEASVPLFNMLELKKTDKASVRSDQLTFIITRGNLSWAQQLSINTFISVPWPVASFKKCESSPPQLQAALNTDVCEMKISLQDKFVFLDTKPYRKDISTHI